MLPPTNKDFGSLPIQSPPFGTIGDPNTLGATATIPDEAGVVGINKDPNGIGVAGLGAGTAAFGYLGCTDPLIHQHAGVFGRSDQQGVMGISTSADGVGVMGRSTETLGPIAGGSGILGVTTNGKGVEGQCNGEFGTGVLGSCSDGRGKAVKGSSPSIGATGILACNDPTFNQHVGVFGSSDNQGVMGLTTSDSGTGVYGGGSSRDGVSGSNSIGVRGETFGGVGVQGQSFGNGLAGKFFGNVEVTGDISLVNADCAEDFDISGTEKIEPGTVMVLDQEGALQQSRHAYDKRVAGVISGAGNFKPAIVLDKKQSRGNRMPIALMGKVFCKVDAQYASIEVGDLLTTSPTLGHGMKAGNPLEAFGAVIGKALRPLKAGQGMIPILIALQ